MKNKKILLSLVSITTLLPFGLVACQNYQQNDKLKEIVPKNRDIIFNSPVPEAEKTEKMLDSLVNQLYKTEAKRTEFYNLQNSEEYKTKTKAEFKKLSSEYLAQDTLEKKRAFLEKLKTFYNKNWYFFLKNIDKFTGEFYDWLLFPNSKEGGHSQEYKETLKTLEKPKKIVFSNPYFNELKEGDESAELPNTTIFYLKKQKNIFRIIISDIIEENPYIEFEPYSWSFNSGEAQNISINLVSDIAHSALVHGFAEGFVSFEKDMVEKQKYGPPSEMVYLWEEKNA
ncbi:aromatic motif membrane protein [Mycoplasma struthionis]|uniref:Lipoprotein n=1 Tax=Mycoplasma struthionis TaxID=538220 RepID=A0A3G8LFY0_9MOLU|nr:aromatic motif membrane protein [Mycoplasma struthionis]AZG68563.1 hypothetical protein EGN60_01065 [Mycoplasma struthionis]